jgi:hypothetical protein
MSSDEQQRKGSGGGFVHTITKRALAPVVASAATALTAFLIRKGTELWQEKVLPKLEEKGGPGTVAREALESVGDKLPSSEKLEEMKEKVGAGSAQPETGSAEDTDRDEERRKRKQRRAQRQRSLEQARSS